MDTKETERNTHRHIIWWWMLSVVVLVAVVIVSWRTYSSVARKRLLHAMLDGGSYSLENNPSTISRLKVIVPDLLDIHRTAVVQCGSAKMTDLTRMDAFNRRITAWHAILAALSLTGDIRAQVYVDAFIGSRLALREEVKHGRDTLEQLQASGAKGS